MVIATYIIFSYILSAVGYGIYHFGVRRYSSIKQQKWVLYTVLGLSLILPFGLIHSNPLFYTEQPHTQVEFHDEPVLTKELLACYTRSTRQEGFCHCEEAQQLNIIQYKKNNYYDTFLTYQSTFRWVLLGIVGFILTVLAFKLLQLVYFIRQSEQEERIVDGKKYTMLINNKSILAASFSLGKRYIIWHTELDKLSDKEQEAILQHEIAHINHRDTWEQIGLSLIQIGWFLNPIFYFIKKELNLINEYLADAFAVQKIDDVKVYATLILKLKANQRLGFVHQMAQNPIQARIVQLFNAKPKRSFLPVWIVIISLLMTTTGWTTAPVMNKTQTEFEEYCHLQKEFKDSGRNVFCKNCLFEDLN